MTTSPTPAPKRSATTTRLRVGSLSNSIGCTSRNRTPSRSGDFFVDQTVPTTLPRNIKLALSDTISRDRLTPPRGHARERRAQLLFKLTVVAPFQNDPEQYIVRETPLVVAQQRP